MDEALRKALAELARTGADPFIKISNITSMSSAPNTVEEEYIDLRSVLVIRHRPNQLLNVGFFFGDNLWAWGGWKTEEVPAIIQRWQTLRLLQRG